MYRIKNLIRSFEHVVTLRHVSRSAGLIIRMNSSGPAEESVIVDDEKKRNDPEIATQGVVKRIRNRPLVDTTAVFNHNAWDNIEWDNEMQSGAAEKILKNSQTKMGLEQQIALDNEAHEKWNAFYDAHQNKFFKDRNWLFVEFPELLAPNKDISASPEEYSEMIKVKRLHESYPGEKSGFKLLEVGCGAGNTVFPVLNGNKNPEVYVYCCDFSGAAIDIVKNREEFDGDRCTPFVLDITDEKAEIPFPPGTIDVAIMIFVLSSISPEKFQIAVKNLNRFLKPGGLLLLRDYGRYDLAQLRFRTGQCISDNFYMRGDGTRVYFFTQEELEDLFLQNGFNKISTVVDSRLQVNRKRQLKMYRIWHLAKFQKKV